MAKAIFLDRDGTIIRDKHFLRRTEEIEFFPDTFTSLRKLQNKNYLLFIITNQSGVARNYFSLSTVEKINRKILEILAFHHIYIKDTFVCPHYEKGIVEEYSIKCNCRKPHNKFFIESDEIYNFDRNSTYVIGDKLSDLEFGSKSQINSILVRTGKGKETEIDLQGKSCKPQFIGNNLEECTDFILRS